MQLKTFFIPLLACSLLAGCYGPGQGRDADAGRARGAQLIRSIEAFHEKNSRYPRTLEELFPLNCLDTNSHNCLLNLHCLITAAILNNTS